MFSFSTSAFARTLLWCIRDMRFRPPADPRFTLHTTSEIPASGDRAGPARRIARPRCAGCVTAGIRLNAVESASASVAVGAMTLTVRYSAGLRPVAGSNKCVNRPAGSNRNPAPADGRDRTIDEVDGFGEHTGLVRIGETDAPRRTLGPRSDRPYLAHVDQRRRKTRFAQPVDDTIGGVALGDAVQRDRGAAFGQRDPVRAHKQAVASHLGQRFGQLLAATAPRGSGLSEEKCSA